MDGAHLVGVVERVVHETRNEGRLADRLLAEKDELELSQGIVERVSGCRHNHGEPQENNNSKTTIFLQVGIEYRSA